MKVGELFVALGFDVDDKKLKEFNSGIQGSVATLGKMAAVAASAVFSIRRLSESAQRAVAIKNFSDQTGVATEELQRFYNVAGRLNTDVTLDNTISAFTRLSEVIADARMGKGPLGTAAQLGIANLGAMSEMQVIQTLRKNFAQNVKTWGGGDEQVVIDMMKQLGIGPEFIRTIKATDEEFYKLWNNPILSDTNIQKLNTLATAQKDLSYSFTLMRDNLSAGISPTVTEFFQNLITVMNKVPSLFQKVRGEFDALSVPLKAITVGLGAAAAAAAALAAPFAPIIMGVGLLLAALNDLGRYLRGESSLTGTALKGAGDIFDKIKGTISTELAKTPEEHRRDRERLLRETSGGSVGPQSYQTNHFTITTTADAGETARMTVNELYARQNRQSLINLGINASGMIA